ncbi:MAG: TIM barrel protein [Candidatus Diapherotrites archaeon]
MIGLSSSYFATKGFGLRDSIINCSELGFSLIELGAAHKYSVSEGSPFAVIKKIRKGFPEKAFTIHGLFPPLAKQVWFNPSLGLTKENKLIAGDMLKAARIVEAEAIGFHPGFLYEMGLEWKKEGYAEAVKLRELNKAESFENLFEVIDFFFKKNSSGTRIAIENIKSQDGALVSGFQGFKKVFKEFPELGLLFDTGHAQCDGTLSGLLKLQEKIFEVHLHSNRKGQDVHAPINSKFLSKLKSIKRIKKIPIILEHFSNVKEEEILKEKRLVENWMEKN